MDSKRNINYRSFEPIIRLLPVTETPECQLWAVWAIANLTKVSSRYSKEQKENPIEFINKRCIWLILFNGVNDLDVMMSRYQHYFKVLPIIC